MMDSIGYSSPVMDVTYHGVDPESADVTARLNAVFALAAAQNRELFLPAGTYRISGPVTYPGSTPRITGSGGSSTIIQATGITYDWLTIGTGVTASAKIGPAGWVRDLRLTRDVQTAASAGSTAGLVLSSAQFVEVKNVWVEYAPLGFDLRNNNYGVYFIGCRTTFDRCRVGLVLRGAGASFTFGSGNDIPFYNCWFSGRDAGVWIEGNGGGYHFHGGQLQAGAGAGSADDLRANVIFNKILATGVAGGKSNATFTGVSFESSNYAHAVRAFGAGATSGVRALFHGCGFFGAAANPGISVLKITSGYDDTIHFLDCEINGVWTSAVPLVLGTDLTTGRPCYFESGTKGTGTFNAVGLDLVTKGMLWLSSAMRGHSFCTFHWQHNGMLFRRTDDTGGAVLQYATNMTTPSWANV